MPSGDAARGNFRAVTPHAILIDIDPKPRTIECVGVTVEGVNRLPGHILCQRAVRQRQTPVDVRNDRGGVPDGALP